MSRFLAFLTIACTAVAAPSPARGATFTVPSDATPTIASANAAAAFGDTINVLPGTYTESGLSLKGTIRGVAGANATIVDAQGRGRVFSLSVEQAPLVVEGLTITGGAGVEFGGGIYCELTNPTIRDCVITGNMARFGAGISFIGALDGTSILRTHFSNNVAGARGGAIYFEHFGGSQPMAVTDCVFEGNAAAQGGGIFVAAVETVAILRCRFLGNTAVASGGGLYFNGLLGSTLSDCTFFGDSAPQGGGVYSSAAGQSLACTRTIIAFSPVGAGFTDLGCDGTTFFCCDIYGNAGGDSFCGTDLGGNFSLDPLFCDAAGGNLELDESSPCLPGNHPQGADCSGTIGALGVGCGVGTAVEETVEAATWGKIKNWFRE